MATMTPRTRNLKLYLSKGITDEARTNLELIDKLGETFSSDNTNSLFIRQKQDIHLLPGDPSVGGTSGQGNLFFGSASSPVNNLKIFTTNFEVTGSFTLKDLSGPARLTLQYNSSLSSPVTDATPRSLSIDVQGSNRVLIMGGGLQTSGELFLIGPVVAGSVSFPEAGTVTMQGATQSLTNKTINASLNTISNISQSNFSPATNLPLAFINGGNVSASEFSSLVGVTSSIQAQLDGKQPFGPYITSLSGAITASGPGNAITSLAPLAVNSNNIAPGAVQDVNVGNGISRSKLAAGGALQVLVNDSSGFLSSESFLAKARGGTGSDNSLVSFPVSGTILTGTNSATISNKIIDGSNNFITNIPYNSLILTGGINNFDIANLANIAYSKLNLGNGIVNNDISPSASIAGFKVVPHFANQLIKSQQGLELSRAGQLTTIEPAGASAGQVADLNFKLPPDLGSPGFFLSTSGAGQLVWANPGFGGTVTSVGLTAPVQFTVTNSPITTAGDLSLNWAPALAASVLAGPISGVASTPSFRALASTDLPSHTHTSSQIVDFTESVQDVLGNTVIPSSSVSWSYNDTANTLAAAVSLLPFSTSDLSEGTNLYFTAERAQDAVLPIISGSPDLTVTYDDVTNSATIVAQAGLITAKPSITPVLADSMLLSDASNSGILSRITLAELSTLLGAGSSSSGAAFNWTALNGTSRTIIHNIGTKDVIVQIFDNVTGEDIYVDSVIRTDTMTVVLQATEAPSSSWRVLIKPL